MNVYEDTVLNTKRFQRQGTLFIFVGSSTHQTGSRSNTRTQLTGTSGLATSIGDGDGEPWQPRGHLSLLMRYVVVLGPDYFEHRSPLIWQTVRIMAVHPDQTVG